MTKMCARCKQKLPKTEFTKNVAKKDGLHNSCKQCKKETQKAWYLKHKKEHIQRAAMRRRKYWAVLANKLRQFKLKNPCIDCGETNPIVLEFDHVKGKKIAAISQMVGTQRPWKLIEKEIEKCVIRCANCHKIKTAKQFGYYKNICC